MKLQQILKVTLNNRLICIHTPPVVYEMPVANTAAAICVRAGVKNVESYKSNLFSR